MIFYWCLPLGVLALVEVYRQIRCARRRKTPPDALARVFRPKEMRELDQHLERIAELEQRSIDAALARYVAGTAGHVVVISESPHGVALGLSDGRRLALGCVSRSALAALKRRAADDRLYPAGVVRDAFSYRLRFRGESGADIELGTRRLTLALAP